MMRLNPIAGGMVNAPVALAPIRRDEGWSGSAVAYGNALRWSRISCWRSGSLSIDRVISRTSHGNGLRSTLVPS